MLATDSARPIMIDRQDAVGLIPATGAAHLVGIGGAGMRALANVMTAQGWRLTGSDSKLLAAKLLPGTQVRVSPGHSDRYLPANTDLVIHSEAVAAENCERRRAARLGIPAVSYPQMLGHLMQGRTGLAIAGTHGKSTTAAMVAAILIRAGLDPTVVIGATPTGWRSGGRFGRGQHVLVEACEYRGNFLHLAPHAGVLLGIEEDHFDYFRSAEHLESTFAQFARQVSPGGFLLARSDCARTREVCRDLPTRVVTFGTNPQDTWRLARATGEAGHYRIEVWRNGRRFVEVRLKTPGRHQAENALAAIGLAGELGVSADMIGVALAEFRGVSRRLETVGTWNGVTVVDDYAHHPTAVAATLQAVREMFPGRRVIAVFEPHQSSRLARLLDEFAQSLQNAERVWMTEVYRAREGREPPRASSADLAVRIERGGGSCERASDVKQLLSGVEREVTPGDVVVMLGAGEIGRVRHAFVERLRRRCAAR